MGKPMLFAFALGAALDAYAALEPEPICWTAGSKADQGSDYCRSCAERRVWASFAAVPSPGGLFVDGGWGGDESDGCAHCADCDCILDYYLTDFGVESELEHFHGRRLGAPVSRETAFHIARVIEAAPENERTLRLARRAVAKIPTELEAGSNG